MKPTVLNEALARRLLHDLSSYIDSNEPTPPAMTRAVLSYFATIVEAGHTPDPRALQYIAQAIRRCADLEAKVVAVEARKAIAEAGRTDTKARTNTADAKIKAGIGNRVVKALGLVNPKRGRPKDRPNRESGLTDSECREIAYQVQEEREKEVAGRRALRSRERHSSVGTPSEVAIENVAASMGMKEEAVRRYAMVLWKEMKAERRLLLERGELKNGEDFPGPNNSMNKCP